MVKPTKVTNSIRSIRFAHGEMTQAELAGHIGVTRQTVIAIEKGRYSPSLEMAFRIAQALNVPLDDVFHYPVPSTNHGDKHMDSEDRKASRSQQTGRFVDELRKLRGRPDTERLVDEIDKLKGRPDTERLIDEIDKLKGRPDMERLVDEIDKLKDQ
jgi:putative transcriptional regulator